MNYEMFAQSQHHQGDDQADVVAASPKIGEARHGWYYYAKPIIEGTLAAVLLILSAPVILVALLLVKLTSRGPAFYNQLRLGKNGKLFYIHKIRTMVHNCEHVSGVQWSKPGDPRVTAIGRILRRTRIDELPQLWNVVRGEMSLVGPRPERPEFLPELEKVIPNYRQRLLVRPGITGLAQIQLPADVSLNCVRRKLAFDLYYIQNCSFWLDARILLCTPVYAIWGSANWMNRILAIPNKSRIERRELEQRKTQVRPRMQPI